MNKIKELILDILLPKYCIGCGKEGQYICDNCELFLSETPNSINNLFTVWEYEGIIEKAIWKIKYGGTFHIIDELVEKAFGKITLELPENIYITYVPMYKKRERERGFNQAELIAKKIGEITSRKVVRLLTKTKDNVSQVGLDPQERIKNVRDVFSWLKPGFNQTKPGFGVLLVDDVYTTGATMKECQKVLKENGVKNIWGFTLSRKMTIQKY